MGLEGRRLEMPFAAGSGTLHVEVPSKRSIQPAWLAWVLPFAVFLVATQLDSLESVRDYYPWAYSAKIAVVLAVCVYCFRAWPPFQSRGMLVAVVVGSLGAVVWIALAKLGFEGWLREHVPYMSNLIPERVAYNPFEAVGDPVARWAFLAVRFFGLVLLVPVVEEVFFRGFLIRYLISEDFEKVPIGAITPFSFAIVTIFFALPHPELLAAIVWGAGINLVWAWTKNLWASVVAHGVTNLLLGVYVVSFNDWILW